jgi:endonuclease YncB( thermonuclease family)
MYWRKGRVLRVHDGDTPALDLKLGFHCKHGGDEVLYRMTGMNAPELNSSDPTVRAKAEVSRDVLKTMIDGREIVVHAIRATRPGAYGRFEVEIWTAWTEPSPGVIEVSGPSVNRIMCTRGQAIEDAKYGAMLGEV